MVRVATPSGKLVKMDLDTWVSLPFPRLWYFTKSGHVSLHLSLHRIAFGPSTQDCVDHKNNDPLDNRKSNLRECSYQENNRNRKPVRLNSKGNKKGSSYKGVLWNKARQRWEARITIPNEYYTNGRSKIAFLGYYNSEVDAAIAYNAGATKYFGQFAYLNKV